MAENIRGYFKADYIKGNPELNLLLNERRLLISALVRTNWNLKKAMELNFPDGGILINGYNRLLLDHQIRVRKKTFVKISEMN